MFSGEYEADAIPERGAVWLDPRLFQLLGLRVGARVSLGTSNLYATRVLTYEPDRGGDMFNIAPRLLMNLADLEGTGLILPGSRATYRLLLAGTDAAVAGFRSLLDDYPEYDVRGIRDARPELRTALDRAEQFLGLAVLVSFALAGLAVALSAQRYAIRHYDNCAIMRCFGAGPDEVVKLYVIQLLITALVCSAIGCGLGYLGQTWLTVLMRDPGDQAITGAFTGAGTQRPGCRCIDDTRLCHTTNTAAEKRHAPAGIAAGSDAAAVKQPGYIPGCRRLPAAAGPVAIRRREAVRLWFSADWRLRLYQRSWRRGWPYAA